MEISLNPYSTGRYSTSIRDSKMIEYNQNVLILILLEDTLRDNVETRLSIVDGEVLILILLEDTLRARDYYAPDRYYSS